jgi:hypothetical protein
MGFVEIPAVGLIEENHSFSFVDNSCSPGTTYYYQVTYQLGTESFVLFETGPVTTSATALELRQSLPNPFVPNGVIGYSVPKPGPVRLEVFDVRGRSVTVLVDEFQSAGTYSEHWNGRDANGLEAPSGVYFYRLSTDNKALSRKMILFH